MERSADRSAGRKSGDGLKVLVIDDEPLHAEAVAETLERVGYDCTVATSGQAGARRLDQDDYDVILTDLKMADLDGLAILRKAQEVAPEARVILITGHGDVKTAVQAMQNGAAHYLTKPVDMAELRAIVDKVSESIRLARANRELQRRLDEKFGFEGVVGNSPKMHEVIRRLQAVAPTDSTVLILGETGTGKDLVAKAIHNNSPRKNKPFVPMNCTALNENLLDDELFGHEAHSFTGADKMRKGRFEYANGGTLFLDEVGDMPINLQAKLLRVLENKEVFRIGSNEPIKVNVRVVAATHRDLEKMVEEGKFRQDLYYRLGNLKIKLPPLRERREDIPLLAARFMKEFADQNGKAVTTIADPVRRLMAGYDWPGNVRELRNFIESMVVLDVDGVLGLDDVPEDSELLKKGRPSADGPADCAGLVGRTLEEIDRWFAERTLERTGGKREEAARILGIGERTLYRMIKDWELQDRIRDTLAEVNGDVSAAAKRLGLDAAELQRKMKKSGLQEGA
jgi:two-component system, NtrC family, response regulator HydG